MKSLTATQYDSLREGAEVEAADQHGEKVLRLTDGTYFKLFRIKRLVTSAWLFPYWKRFTDNAVGLAQLGVPTLTVREVYDLPDIRRTAVHYDPLPGETLRQAELDAALVRKLGAFLCSLHDKGIYLRSLHLGNIVLTPEGDLGLIDFADMHIHGRSLRRGLRFRNFYHLCRYEDDRRKIAVHLDEFVSAFAKADQPRIRKMFSA